jgi:hypothetical protein
MQTAKARNLVAPMLDKKSLDRVGLIDIIVCILFLLDLFFLFLLFPTYVSASSCILLRGGIFLGFFIHQFLIGLSEHYVKPGMERWSAM